MTAPNRLAGALNYVATAYRYAFAQKASGQARTVLLAPLRELAEKDRWSQDTMDVEQIIKLAMTCSWVYSAITLIADRVSSKEARFKVKRRQRATERLQDEINHPFELLLERPNSIMTFEDIMEYTTFWAHLAGNAYLFVSTHAPGVGEPQEIWPLPANLVRPLPETLRLSAITGGLCIDYEYKIDNKRHRLPGENVIHIRFPNPFDYWRGLSPLTAALSAIRIDHNQKKYIDSFFGKDNAVPTAVISLPPETSPIDFEIAKEQIREQFGEGRRSAIIRAGDMSVQTIAQTMSELQINEARRFTRDEIYQIYGVPVGMLSEGMSGDSRLATEIAFTRNRVQPFLNRIAAKFTADLAPYYGEDIVIVAPSIVPQDRSLEIQEYTTYSQELSPNEARELRGVPKLSAYDVLDQINKERERRGMEPAELADDSLEFMLNMPIRLHPFISSATFTSPYPPEYANVPGEQTAGDLPGSMSGSNFASDQAVRSAQQLGVVTELLRWQKVALREAREGKNPGGRTFTSAVLPEPFVLRIRQRLDGADESQVKAIFTNERENLASSSEHLIPASIRDA